MVRLLHFCLRLSTVDSYFNNSHLTLIVMVWHCTSVIRTGCSIRGHQAGAGHQWSDPGDPGDRRHQGDTGIMSQVLTTSPDTRKCWYNSETNPSKRSFKSIIVYCDLISFEKKRCNNDFYYQIYFYEILLNKNRYHISENIFERMNFYLLMIHFYDALHCERFQF